MHPLWQDFRYALRTLCTNPGFTAITVLVLALAIGGNSAIISVVNGVLLKPLGGVGPLCPDWTTSDTLAMSTELDRQNTTPSARIDPHCHASAVAS